MHSGGGLAGALTYAHSFGYDGVNRLTSAAESGNRARGFNYDTWGNGWVDLTRTSGIAPAGNTPTANIFNPANNTMAGGSYDFAGNLVAVNGNQLSYDAENRVVRIAEGNTIETIFYDGNGQRFQKNIGITTALYVYDAFGTLAAQYSSGAAVAAPCATCYLSADQVGSTRLVTSQTGAVVARHDFLPFGGEITTTGGRTSQWGSTTDVQQKFTGQLRDTESGLDFFNARYYGYALNRFTSPDPANAGADLSNPQTWNGYAYVANNPVVNVDPSGLDSTNNGGVDSCSDPKISAICQAGYSSPYSNFPSLTPGLGSFSSWNPLGFLQPDASSGYQQSAVFSAGGVSQSVLFDPQYFSSFSSTASLLAANGGAAASTGTAVSQLGSALGAWLASGPKYIHYAPSDPYTKDFKKSNAMLYINTQIRASCGSSSGGVAVGTGRAFVLTVLDALSGSLSLAEAQFGALNASYNLSGNQAEVTVSNSISNNSAFYHIPSGLGMSGSYADQFGRLEGNVPTGAVLQEMTIKERNPCF